MQKLRIKLAPKFSSHSPRLRLAYFGMVALILLLGFGLYLALRSSANAPIANSDYKNLNLSVAAGAKYPSLPLKITKDIGLSNGAQHKLINFAVKDDNLTESGLMTLPLTAPPPSGYPVIILCHGYVNPLYYRTEVAYVSDMEFYSSHGFAVIKPDFRGQGNSINAGSPEGAFYSMAYNTDLLSLISAVRDSKNFNHKDINLWGQSMGAYVALRASVLSPDIKTAVLLSGPVGTSHDLYSDYLPTSDTNNPLAAKIRARELTLHGTPDTDPAFWADTSPLSFLNKTKTYYQIHVGTNDQVVPPKFSAELDSALSSDKRQHQYFVYAGGGHGLEAQRPQIWARSLAAFQKS